MLLAQATPVSVQGNKLPETQSRFITRALGCHSGERSRSIHQEMLGLLRAPHMPGSGTVRVENSDIDSVGGPLKVVSQMSQALHCARATRTGPDNSQVEFILGILRRGAHCPRVLPFGQGEREAHRLSP